MEENIVADFHRVSYQRVAILGSVQLGGVQAEQAGDLRSLQADRPFAVNPSLRNA